MKRLKSSRPAEVIGWRELVTLPDLGISNMRAKIDTGARTSALHAVDQQPFNLDGIRWVGFSIPLSGTKRIVRAVAKVLDERQIKNTSGIPERRLIIRLNLLIGRHHWHVETSLANREKMEFDLILGRTALRGRGLLVNPGRSFLLNSPQPRKSRNIKSKT